jgi:hypothetical protein
MQWHLDCRKLKDGGQGLKVKDRDLLHDSNEKA